MTLEKQRLKLYLLLRSLVTKEKVTEKVIAVLGGREYFIMIIFNEQRSRIINSVYRQCIEEIIFKLVLKGGRGVYQIEKMEKVLIRS